MHPKPNYDITAADGAIDYAQRLLNLAATGTDVSAEMRLLADGIAAGISLYAPEALGQLLPLWDVIHSLAYRRRLPHSAFRPHLDRWFSAAPGRIAESDLFATLKWERDRFGAEANPTRLSALANLRLRWLSTLEAHNRFPSATPAENRRRLDLILAEDLTPRYRFTHRTLKQRLRNLS